MKSSLKTNDWGKLFLIYISYEIQFFVHRTPGGGGFFVRFTLGVMAQVVVAGSLAVLNV
jgi:hypothetical protein